MSGIVMSCGAGVFIFRVEGGDGVCFGDAMVSNSTVLVVLDAEPEGLKEKHDRDTAERNKQQADLDKALTLEEWFIDSTWLEEHEDKHVQD